MFGSQRSSTVPKIFAFNEKDAVACNPRGLMMSHAVHTAPFGWFCKTANSFPVRLRQRNGLKDRRESIRRLYIPARKMCLLQCDKGDRIVFPLLSRGLLVVLKILHLFLNSNNNKCEKNISAF